MTSCPTAETRVFNFAGSMGWYPRSLMEVVPHLTIHLVKQANILKTTKKTR